MARGHGSRSRADRTGLVHHLRPRVQHLGGSAGVGAGQCAGCAGASGSGRDVRARRRGSQARVCLAALAGRQSLAGGQGDGATLARGDAAALLADARTLRIGSLVGVLEARFRRLAFIAAHAMLSSVPPTAPTPAPVSSTSSLQRNSGVRAADPNAASVVAVSSPGAGGGRGKRKKKTAGGGGAASAIPRATAGPSSQTLSPRSQKARRIFWTHAPLLRTLRAAMWDSLEGHVVLSQVNRTLRHLYCYCGVYDADRLSEGFWAELCARRGFAIPPRAWPDRRPPAHPWRRTAAAIVRHAHLCETARCREILSVSRAFVYRAFAMLTPQTCRCASTTRIPKRALITKHSTATTAAMSSLRTIWLALARLARSAHLP